MSATVHSLHWRHLALARGRIAAHAVREAGGSELEAALACIRATFDEQCRADMMRERKQQRNKNGNGNARAN